MTRSASRWLAGAVLVAVTWCVYLGVRTHDFVGYDDDIYIVHNPHLRGGLTLPAVRWAFTSTYETNWIPLTWISYLIDYELFELAPAGVLLTNVFLHSLSVLILFGALVRLTSSTWKSAFVATVFALHPLHVESVAWASERKDVLSGLFWMLSLWAYARFAERPGSLQRYLLVFGSLALGLLAKPMLVTLPFVLLLLDFWPLRRLARAGSERLVDADLLRRTLCEKLPLFALVAAASVVTYIAQQSKGAMADWTAFPVSVRASNALISYVSYIGKALWPSGLAVFYPHPKGAVSFPLSLAAGLVLLLLTALAIRLARRRPYLPVGWFWYLGTLVPVIGIVQVGAQAMADRYTYIPLVGLSIAMAWGVEDLIGQSHRAKAAAAALGGVGVAALGFAASLQVGHWRDGESLFRHALRVAEPSHVAHCALGSALIKRGSANEALKHFEEAVRIAPELTGPRVALASALYDRGQIDRAIRQYRLVLKIDPEMAVAHGNLGVALRERGDLEAARAHLTRALQLAPDVGVAQIHANLGMLLKVQGDVEGALRHYRAALLLDPGYSDAHANVGFVLMEEGRLDEALEHLRIARELGLERDEVHAGMAEIFRMRGEVGRAAEHYRKALRLRPGWPLVANNLAWMLATHPDRTLRDGAEAVRISEALCESSEYSDPAILDTLAVSYAAAGRFGDAVRTADQALALARTGADLALLRQLETRRELFERGQSVVESAPRREKRKQGEGVSNEVDHR